MKQIIFSLCFLLSICASSYSQTNRSPKPELVTFKLKNNALLPSKVTVISYLPGESGNGTNGFLLMPYCSKSFSFPIGTKIYLASSQQINTVMSGAKISNQPPFLEVKKEDEGQSFNIK